MNQKEAEKDGLKFILVILVIFVAGSISNLFSQSVTKLIDKGLTLTIWEPAKYDIRIQKQFIFKFIDENSPAFRMNNYLNQNVFFNDILNDSKYRYVKIHEMNWQVSMVRKLKRASKTLQDLISRAQLPSVITEGRSNTRWWSKSYSNKVRINLWQLRLY